MSFGRRWLIHKTSSKTSGKGPFNRTARNNSCYHDGNACKSTTMIRVVNVRILSIEMWLFEIGLDQLILKHYLDFITGSRMDITFRDETQNIASTRVDELIWDSGKKPAAKNFVCTEGLDSSSYNSYYDTVATVSVRTTTAHRPSQPSSCLQMMQVEFEGWVINVKWVLMKRQTNDKRHYTADAPSGIEGRQ